jgi:hypothetical protein
MGTSQRALICRIPHCRRGHRRRSPWAAKVYADAIARGHDHPHAVRVLARAWIRVIYRCWNTNTPYDALKHGNAAALLQPQSAA